MVSKVARAMHQAVGAAGAPGSAETSGDLSFQDTLRQMIGEVSDLQEGSKNAIEAFVRGDPVEVHQVMAAAEEAGIALDFLIEIRNRLTEAYRTVIQMQN